MIFGIGQFNFCIRKTLKRTYLIKKSSLNFIKVRLGHAKYVQNVPTKEGIDQIVYRPLHQIMKILNHQNFSLDLLKIDIENDEWKVFENSIFKVCFIFVSKAS